MNRLHHVSLLARDKHELHAFYVEVLGLRFIKNTVNQDNLKMLHYYYGDYRGTPGTVITFFLLPSLGHRYDKHHYYGKIQLNLPANSLDFWEKRLTDHQIASHKHENQLQLSGPDDVALVLVETDLPPLPENQVVQNDIPADKQLLGLRGIAFHVPDPAATREFFTKLLGWEATGNTVSLSGHELVTIFPTETSEITRMGRGSADHIAFSVENETALDQLHEKAQKQGWAIERMVTRGYFKSLYIREPGGNRVEFATVGPGFTLDEELAQLGEHFALPPFLEPKRAAIEAYF